MQVVLEFPKLVAAQFQSSRSGAALSLFRGFGGESEKGRSSPPELFVHVRSRHEGRRQHARHTSSWAQSQTFTT